MHISVAGQHVTLSPELQLYVKDKIVETVGRYFEHATSASVHFTKDGPFVLCDMIVHEGSGGNIVIKTEASSDEIYASFDLALAKSEKRLHKYKSKLKDRHHRVKISEIDIKRATKYIISAEDEQSDETGPLIIAEKEISVPKITVSEAVMKMELENLPALMFKNSKTDRTNVVYLRNDGNISWVDSQ